VAGLPLRNIRAGLHAIAQLLAPRRRAAPARRAPSRRAAAAAAAARCVRPRLLLGWRSREALLGTHPSIVTTNGIFRPIALVRGHAATTWSMPCGEVLLEHLGRITPRGTTALAADARDVVRYLASA
jgi:hypothetical protein